MVCGLKSVFERRVLPCAQAEKRMLEKNENKEYLPIEGLAAFREATLNLLLGDQNPAVKEVSGGRQVMNGLAVHGCCRASPDATPMMPPRSSDNAGDVKSCAVPGLLP